MKKFFIMLVMMCFMLSGCSSNTNGGMYESLSSDNKVVTDSFGYDKEAPQMSLESTNDIFKEFIVEEHRKLIKNYTYSLQTKEFDAFISLITDEVARVGGYIQSSTISGNSYYHSGNRFASYCIRVPSGKVDVFIESIDATELAVVTRFNENVDDITTSYYDTEARIVALEKEESALLNLMDLAKTVDEIITIESKLSDVRYELESYKRQLKNYDLLISYSTFTIDVNEVERVVQAEKKTMFEEISYIFMNSIEDSIEFGRGLIICVLGNSLYIGIFISLAIMIYQILKKYLKKINFSKKTVDKTNDI